MAQQTAVEWYYQQTVIEGKTNYYELLEHAKIMEKEQLDKAYYQGQESKCIGGPLYTELYNK